MSGKRRASANGQNASGNAAAGGSGAAKRAKPSGPKKSRPTLVAGLQATLPAQPGPWLQRCIERWGLVAPYDPSVTEAQWEAYFKERAALEWHTNAFLAEGKRGVAEDGGRQGADGAADQGEAEQAEQGTWPFDWEKPANLRKFCQEYYGENKVEELRTLLETMRSGVQRSLNGCKGVPGAAELGAALSHGVFITNYWINWQGFEDPRTVDIYARIYSPCALATSIAFSYNYHHRNRMSFAEHLCTCKLVLRGAAAANPEWPQQPAAATTVLFSMDLQDSGYEKRKFMGMQGLRGLAAHLLGRKGLIGERKAFGVAAIAAGVTAVRGADVEFAFRVTRRKHKLLAGEESDAASADDSDSDNEGKMNARSAYGEWGYDGGYDEFGPDEGTMLRTYARRQGYPEECCMM